MKFIKCQKINMRFLIPVFGGFFAMAYRIIIPKIPKYDIIGKNPFIYNVYSSLGMILAFVPYLILKHRSKTSSNSETQAESKLNLELLYNEQFIDNPALRLKLIVFSSIFDLMGGLLDTLFCYNCIFNLWILDIILMNLFSFLLLKYKLYRHQYFSMTIIIIFGLMLNIIEYYKSDDKSNKLNFFEIFIKFLCEISYSIGMVINKYNMQKTYCSPYKICFCEGTLELILYIIVLVIINTIGVEIQGIQYPDNFYELFNNYGIYDFILCFIMILAAFIFNIVLLVTCDYFTPVHILIISIIKECYSYLQFEKNNAILNISGFIILLLIAIMFLIFIEVIEINICNISYNTKNNILKRALTISNNDNNNRTSTQHEADLIELNTLDID